MAAIVVLVWGGCTRQGAVVAACPPAEISESRANLALGGNPQDVVVASRLMSRREWPAVSVGYVLDDITFLCDVQFDDQYFYDRLGGYSRLGQTIRTAVTLR